VPARDANLPPAGAGPLPPASGGQHRLGWTCSTLLAVLAVAALLGACRDVTAPAATATSETAATHLSGAPTVTLAPTVTPQPSPTRTPTVTSTGTATATRTATRTATASRTATRTSTPTARATATVTATPRPTRVLESAEVFEVIDGDTIGVRINGQAYRVRYIGIDTPEIVHPGIPVEPYGPEAAEANRRMVLGQQVMLERDVSDTDTYGRLLRYVWLGDTMVNAELVRLGLAKANSYAPDLLYQERLDALEAEALAAGLGIWSITPTPPPPAGERSHALGVFIAAVDKRSKPEVVTLTNDALGPVDLSGWTLVSVRGNQRYTIPGGTRLDPGSSVTIYSGPGADSAGGLFWTIEYIWNNSELDPAELYDATGALVDRWEG
jgi:micrococcal nuclease